jgi:hypothetical protein
MKVLEAFRRLGRREFVFIAALLLTAMPSRAEVNSWVKATDGLWQETNSWSLGILPDSSQHVLIANITNGSEITVTINSDTAQNYPQSLAINNLAIYATNTLLLNNVGMDVPLTVTNGLWIFGASSNTPATLINLQSGLIVESGALEIFNGQIIQSGGFIKVTNGPTYLNGHFYLTNGFFEAGDVRFGFDPNGFFQTSFFDQYGGTANVANLSLGSAIPGNTYSIYAGELHVSDDLAVGGSVRDAHFYQYGGRVTTGDLSIGSHDSGDNYTLYNGELVVRGRLSIHGDYGAENFVQEGGTNFTSELEIRPLASSPKYTLNNGLLCTSNVTLEVGYSEPVFEQNGGIHIVADTLTLIGLADRYGTDFANYFLTNGYLSAKNIVLQASAFSQANSTTSVSGTFQLGRYEDSRFGQLFLDSGTLGCANVSYVRAGADIFQNGGEFIVTNLFSFGGYRHWYPPSQPRYLFSGGTLTARNIQLDAGMFIGSSTPPGRITNPGYFKLSGEITLSNANEHLGRFILATHTVTNFVFANGMLVETNSVITNATINFTGNNGVLAFANSTAEAWDGATKLFVTNWNGSLTGGGDDQLRFGNDASALTAAQLNQIRFVNPSGFPPGEFLAQILDTGEVVPKPSPAISFGQSGTNFVLSWSADFTLQTATNVSGPYENLTGAISPYTNFSPSIPERYFRLRR